MKINVIGTYKAGDSVIHKIDPRIKLCLSFALMILVFFLRSPLALGMYGLFTFTLVLLAKMNLKRVFNSIKPILFILSFAFIINIFTVPGESIWSWGFLSISREGLYSGILVSVRLILLTIQTNVLISYTTSSLLLADAIESLLSPLKKINVPVQDFALMISIALRFVPTLAEEAEKIMKAQSARGANYDTGKFKDKVKGMITILVPLFVNAVKRSEELAIALEARAYGISPIRTKYKPLKLAWNDLIFSISSVVVITLIIVLEIFF